MDNIISILYLKGFENIYKLKIQEFFLYFTIFRYL